MVIDGYKDVLSLIVPIMASDFERLCAFVFVGEFVMWWGLEY